MKLVERIMKVILIFAPFFPVFSDLSSVNGAPHAYIFNIGPHNVINID